MIPDKIYIRNFEQLGLGMSSSWHIEPYGGNLKVKDEVYIRKDALMEWLKPLEKEYRERTKQGEMVSQIAGTFKQVIDKLESL